MNMGFFSRLASKPCVRFRSRESESKYIWFLLYPIILEISLATSSLLKSI